MYLESAFILNNFPSSNKLTDTKLQRAKPSTTMSAETTHPEEQLHIIFFPFLADGHMIPILDIARMFSSRGVKSTIITTPQNAPTFTKSLNQHLKTLISIKIFFFPAKEAGLPEGVENLEKTSGDQTLFKNFILATEMLQEQLENFLLNCNPRPHGLVADMFFPWATDVAHKFNIPRLLFHGTSFLALCCTDHLRIYQPQAGVESDHEPFVLPNLPDEIKLTRSQIPDDFQDVNAENDFTKLMKRVRESDRESYGVIVNSFYELEPAYADHYRRALGRKAWHIGPVSLCYQNIEEKIQRGKQASVDQHHCIQWLDSKPPSSVIYICFGSTAKFSCSQLHEIALALEASDQNFIWVIRGCNEVGESNEKPAPLPKGFEKRIENRGLIIEGWAPQVLILDHEAVGGFMTHCGWNSTLEGICAAKPMITWPLFAEQFFNEKLVIRILKIGVPVGARKWSTSASSAEIVKKDKIERAVREVMVGDEANEMADRAKKLKDMAWEAVREGGSSWSDLTALLEELRSYRH